MEDGQGGGFDAGAFAARMSSIGHAGNGGGSEGGSGGGGNSKIGALAGEIGFDSTMNAAFDFVGQSGTLNIFPVFQAFSSLLTMKIFPSFLEATSQYLSGLLAPLPSPLSSLPTPNQAFQSGKKQGQAAGGGH